MVGGKLWDEPASKTVRCTMNFVQKKTRQMLKYDEGQTYNHSHATEQNKHQASHQVGAIKRMHYFINIFIFASCIIATILAADLDLVDLWLNRQELNKYGDSVDTMYAGGSPLFNENTGESVDRYLYLTTKFPSFPWLDNYEEEKEGPTPLDEGDACVDTVGKF